MAKIQYEPGAMTVQQIVLLFRNGQLDLQPGFQRESVWSDRDRSKLIDSLLRNYRVPSLFFYRSQDQGQLLYHVLDGKQRIETILRFTGDIRGSRFSTLTELPDSDGTVKLDWRVLQKQRQQHLLMGYRLQTIEVTGDLSDVIDLFVRINSTGRALTGAEKRRAKYFTSEFLKKAEQLGRRYEEYFGRMGILSANQIARMKHIELICELMLAAHTGDVTNKKTALDRAMDEKSLKGQSVSSSAAKTVQCFRRIERMFPKLKTTRFSHPADFYTLAVLIQKFESERLILTERRRNALAWNLLLVFSNGVDEVRHRQKKMQPISEGQASYRDYLQTVQEGTDEANNRRNRENLMRALLETSFRRKDKDRVFSPEQQRLIWNSISEHRCRVKGCNETLTWEDFTVDHVQPYSKGGKTEIKNAELLCRHHNSSLGNRRKRYSKAMAA